MIYLKQIFSYILMTAGALITAAGTMFFMVPNDIAPAGFTGIATILNKAFLLPIGITVLFLNIPFFAFAYKEYGKKFFIKTMYSLVVYSLFTELLPLYTVSGNDMLSAAVGGVLYGVGIGLVLLGGGTTGGTELVAKLIIKKTDTLSIGNIIFIVDALVLAAACFVFGIEKTLYAAVALFISSKVIDLISGGSVMGRAYYIFSSQNEMIYDEVSDKIARGGTYLYAQGAYSKKYEKILMCVVHGRVEAVKLKDIVRRKDKDAFIMSCESREIYGYGFRQNKRRFI